MKEKELKELKLTKNIIIPFPNFQQNTIISPTQMNDNFEEIEHAYNTLIDNHNGAITKINKALSDITSTDNDAISNEQARIQAEETRVQNEEQRISDENERRTEEKKRIAMYNTHLNDELRREQKHTEMVNTFDTKVSEVNTFVDTKKEEIDSFVSTKTEEVEEFVDLKTNQVDSFITTKTTEVNAFVTAKGQEVQNAINAIPPKSELIGAKGDKGDKGEKGDKGDRGEQGLQGIQGIQGLQGVKGDKGDKGEQGIQGLKGDKGDKGDRGEQGVKGDTPSITHLETSINNKIQEVETRFNTLTSTQQQDAEVIDARDGEVSLKARLDRDIEKANKELDKIKKLEESTVSTVETESDFTTVEATSNGYFEDVKLEGKTLVNHLLNSENTVSSSSATNKNYVGLQVGKTYTAVVYVIENNNNKPFHPFRITYSDNVQVNIPQSVYPKGSVITHKFELADKQVKAIWVNWCATYESGDIITTKTLLLEGDHTQNPPSYFEGLKSVGQDVDEISVESVKGDGNLFDGTLEIGSISADGKLLEWSPFVRTDYINVKPGVSVFCKVLEYDGITPNIPYTQRLCEYDINKNFIKSTADNKNVVVLSDKTKYIRYSEKVENDDANRVDLSKVNKLLVCYASSETDYTPHKQDKKRLLYYNNETQTWEKPILRQWDSIEKHANGKYYYHQRSGEVVLNGSENWGLGTNLTNTLGFNVSCVGVKQDGELISTTLKRGSYYQDNENIHFATNNGIFIRILKSKLSTQDVAGFKQWLQANNVTVVYQLAQEKVYECTNIDLITYANETNYIVECGAIVPRSTLKVHNNISNVVRTLQEKVSLLEDKFIMGLKQILAGDMYSLAELLYPEDFVSKEEPIDVPTLLI